MDEALPVGYYLDNFDFLLSHVHGQYGDILSREEADYAACFRQLSPDARRLYVRLASRKGPLFRSDKLNYPEIGDLHEAALELTAAGYLDDVRDAGADELLALLTRQELLRLDTGAPLRRTARREQLVEVLLDVMESPAIIARCPFSIWRPLKLEILQIYKLLFFGNLNQDLTEFVLHELGITPFEQYAIHRDVRFFEDRRVMEQTLDLYLLRDEAQEVVECGDAGEMKAFLDRVPPLEDLVSDRLARRRDRIINDVARQLEREGEFEHALIAYGDCRAAPARERRARIHDRRSEFDAALAICREILDAPEDEAEYEFAVRFARRLCRKTAADTPACLPDPAGDDFVWRAIAVPFDPDEKVEMLARSWFEGQGHNAWYVENGLLPGLFGLTFWDIIFSPVRGAFHHPFQRGPADLFTADFRETRRASIERRFEEIGDANVLRRHVESRFESKWGLANHFVDWRVLDDGLIDKALREIPLDHLLSVFRRLLRDLKSNRSGFPDLAVFPSGGGYLLVEVKGPGDTLQNNQKRWLRHFREVGIPAEVVRVSWL